MTEQSHNIVELLKAGQAIDQALNKATREAVKRHQLARQPVAGWQDGKIVWLPAPSNELHG
jgi:hypothetical protein